MGRFTTQGVKSLGPDRDRKSEALREAACKAQKSMGDIGNNVWGCELLAFSGILT